MPQDLTLDREMTGKQSLRIQAKLYDVPENVAREKVDELLKLVDLYRVADREIGTYSWGMQKRLELVMGLVHTPKVLFLDEPTLGLDAQSRFLIWEYIRKLNNDYRVTVFLTTHYLEEADELSDRIGIIDEGRLKAIGSPEQLKADLGGETIELRLGADSSGLGLEAILEPLPGVVKVFVDGVSCHVETVKADSVIPRLVVALASKGVEVKGVIVTATNLNQVFQRYATSSARSGEGEADGIRMLMRDRALSQRT